MYTIIKKKHQCTALIERGKNPIKHDYLRVLQKNKSVGYILGRIYKTWFTWFWRLKSLMTCYLKGGKPGKVKIQQSECEDLRTGEWGRTNNVSPSLSSNDQKSGKALSECRRNWISQLKQNVNSSFLLLFVIFRTSTDWIVLSHLDEGIISSLVHWFKC